MTPNIRTSIVPSAVSVCKFLLLIVHSGGIFDLLTFGKAIVGFNIPAPLFEVVELAAEDPVEVCTLCVVPVTAVIAAPCEAAVVVADALAGLFITFPTDEQNPLKLFQFA